jgi:hypothetical protein
MEYLLKMGKTAISLSNDNTEPCINAVLGRNGFISVYEIFIVYVQSLHKYRVYTPLHTGLVLASFIINGASISSSISYGGIDFLKLNIRQHVKINMNYKTNT